MARATAMLSLMDGEKETMVERQVWTLKSAPGLAVHEALSESDYWTVSHLASGKAIWSWAPSKTAAADFAEIVAVFGDWTVPEEELDHGLKFLTRKLIYLLEEMLDYED